MENSQLTFVCWKWEAPHFPHKRKKRNAFSAKHVNILYAMLYRNLSVPFRLICVTDDKKGIRPEVEIVPLWDEFMSLGGCFLRLVPFKSGFSLFGDKFISIDLDCVILSDVTDLFTRDEDFVIWHPRKAVRWLDKGEKGRYYCGSLWMLKAGTRSIVYDKFNPGKLRLGFNGRYEGGTDQKHISQLLYPNEACWTVDDGVCTFVEDVARPKKGVPVKNPKIVFFNGRFMPDDPECMRFNWIQQHYHDGLGKREIFVSKPEPVPVPKVETGGGNDKVTIASFFWGNWPEKSDLGLGMQYVKQLYNGVKRNMPPGQDYEFVLFTNDFLSGKIPDEIVIRPLEVDVDLKWNLKKMFMFSKGSQLEHPTICFDLDTVVVADLSWMIKQTMLLKDIQNKARIITCEDAYALGKAGGSIVAFVPCPELERTLWEPLINDREHIEHITGGSERFYYRQKSKANQLIVDFWEKLRPGYVLSYKRDCGHTSKKPKFVSVIRFHGKPRPHQVARGWIREALRNG